MILGRNAFAGTDRRDCEKLTVPFQCSKKCLRSLEINGFDALFVV